MASAFLAARILPSPSAAQGSRAGSRAGSSPQDWPWEGPVPTATCVPRFAAQLRPGLSARAERRQPRARQCRAARAGLAPVCSWMEFKELIRSSAGFFLPCFQREILPRIRSWLCLDQPLTAAPQPLREQGGLCWAPRRGSASPTSHQGPVGDKGAAEDLRLFLRWSGAVLFRQRGCFVILILEVCSALCRINRGEGSAHICEGSPWLKV